MALTVGIPKESFPGERRVAMVPAVAPLLIKKGFRVLIEPGAGEVAGCPDEAYRSREVEVASSREEVFSQADVLFQVRTPGANRGAGEADTTLCRENQIVIGFADPLISHDAIRAQAAKRVSLFAVELLPRVSRAQSMDALSSMATVAGYRSALLAAHTFGRMFPMMMTAAGTVSPAKVLVIGVGVAGLQAIATSRQLGAVVTAYDIRAAAKGEAESLGAKFLELDLAAEDSQDASGYAKAQSEDFYRRQQEMLADAIAGSDILITTAAVPGKKAPVLVKADVSGRMAPGSVIVDLAAERGGNCEATVPGETVTSGGVTILGPNNLPSEVPFTASQLYARNLTNFLLHLCPEGEAKVDSDDEIIRGTLVCRGGEVVNPQVREALGLSTGSSE